jgi:hypothetical protein
MCTKWQDRAPKPKRRGIKRYHNEKVTTGTVLVHQSYRTFFPGMNVGFIEKVSPFRTFFIGQTLTILKFLFTVGNDESGKNDVGSVM